MRSVHLFLVLGIAVVGVAYLVFSPGPRHSVPVVVADAESADPTGDLIIGKPIVWQNLAIFPVSSKLPRLSDRFITLDEGLRAGTVEIFERGAASAGGQPANDDPFGSPTVPAPDSAPDPFATPGPAATAQRPTQPVAEPVATPAPPAADPFATPTQQLTPVTAANSNNGAATESAQQSGAQQLAAGNSVNELLVINRSDRPLYLMPGEVIIGGDQDRTIAEELVIAPGGKPTAIDVFCVEHGRWGGRTQSEYAQVVAQAAADGQTNALAVERRAASGSENDSQSLSLVVSASQIAEQANSGKFVGSVGSLNKPVRLAVQADGVQGKVWDEVANQNLKGAVRASTGTFAANYSEAEATERFTPFLTQLQEPVVATPNVVGVIVAVNGEIESLDVFESTPLFKKLWPKLLKSYALDASLAEPVKVDARTATVEDAHRFMRDIAMAKSKQEDAQGELAITRSENDNVLAFSVHERRPQPAAAAMGSFGGMGGGFFGGAVHSAGFSK